MLQKASLQRKRFYRLDMPEGYKHFSKTKSMKLEHCEPVREWWNDRKEVIIADGDFTEDRLNGVSHSSYCIVW